jgi:SAM-dependent methyltransferase
MTPRDDGAPRLNSLEIDDTHPYFLHYRSYLADVKKAAVHAHGKLLDIGCGNKPFEKLFKPFVTEHIGCDVAQSSDHRVDFICSATKLPFEDSSYNTVLSTQVIEHVADHQAFLSEVFRVLKSNGVLILSGPMYWPLHEEPYDFFRFTEHGFRFLLERLGFVKLQVLNNGGKWALCGQVMIHTIEKTRWYRGFIIRFINRFFADLDDRLPNRTNPMNYVIIARKP